MGETNAGVWEGEGFVVGDKICQEVKIVDLPREEMLDLPGAYRRTGEIVEQLMLLIAGAQRLGGRDFSDWLRPARRRKLKNRSCRRLRLADGGGGGKTLRKDL